MIIAIDGYEANVVHRVGIGRYAYEIIKHIYDHLFNQAVNDKYKNISVRIYLPDKPLSDLPPVSTKWQYRISQPRKLWTFIGLPMAIASDFPKSEVIFSPTHYIPRFVDGAKVMSIMDLSYIKYPQLFKAKDLYQLTKWTEYSIAHTKRIFTISQAAKHDIINQYHVPENRIVVTYPGIKILNSEKLVKDDMINKYQISKNFILSVGTLQPRKNYVKLISAFALFLKQNRQKFHNLELVIIGKKGWMYEAILAAPQKFGIESQVKFLDFVVDADLPYFYNNALCFVLPSLYEGFGLPVAEAMSYGCPVVVSKVSSLPEIAGNAGIYIDPENVESIAKGMLTAVRQRNLIQGKIRSKNGLELVKQFSWEKSAQLTLDTLINVANS
jgi:glycosyltransferase involved in cell wall biosynthesis